MNQLEDLNHLNFEDIKGENYFIELIKMILLAGKLSLEEVEELQINLLNFLAKKCDAYFFGENSSIRIETAQSIMNSINFTLAIYFKNFSSMEEVVSAIKNESVVELYKKGRRIIDVKIKSSNHVYKLVIKSKLQTPNYTYNATISENGLGLFIKKYNAEFEAHEMPASIDYQLCNMIGDLEGVEYFQKYVESLYLENLFCAKFDVETIDHVLLRYDVAYKDLLINVFEQILTVAVGCVLANRSPFALEISVDDVEILYQQFKLAGDKIMKRIETACNVIIKIFEIDNNALKLYIKQASHKVYDNVNYGMLTGSLAKVFLPYQ